MTDAEIADRLASLEGWSRQGDAIVKTYRFRNFHETMAFVNAVAWIAHLADHHPDLAVGYDRCQVLYTTHDAGGVSRQDFVCAAKIEALFGGR